jgi:hypothetical protein
LVRFCALHLSKKEYTERYVLDLHLNAFSICEKSRHQRKKLGNGFFAFITHSIFSYGPKNNFQTHYNNNMPRILPISGLGCFPIVFLQIQKLTFFYINGPLL